MHDDTFDVAVPPIPAREWVDRDFDDSHFSVEGCSLADGLVAGPQRTPRNARFASNSTPHVRASRLWRLPESR
jgi:hypothetical protein